MTFPPTGCAQSKMSHCPKRSGFVIVNTRGEDADELLVRFAVGMMWTVCTRSQQSCQHSDNVWVEVLALRRRETSQSKKKNEQTLL